MNRPTFALLAVFSSLLPPAAAAAQVRVNGHTFTIPEGFVIEQVAGPPLVDRPIVGAFDEQGRLYVADSSGSNDKVDKQLDEKPHRIVRLEDTDGDGRFDKSVVFADRMMFPEGTMWHDGSLYVAAPPSIWKLTDTDGDGQADARSEWFQGKTLTGCANDLHGPYLGPDGWIYWCKGAFAKQTYERPGKPPFVTRAAHIFRCRPDGTGIEPVMTGGMDNPVDVVFTPGGERIFTTTFLQRPEAGRRDGLIHAVYGGLYGKVNDVLDDHKHTSPDLMPVLSHLGPAAPCGFTRYESSLFGDEYRDNLFASLFNLQKVTRHVLSPDGATFASKDSDFIVSENHDFHPTDVFEDADGSLIVIDTGGWYKLCCPSSQLYKPDLLGAIYRVRKAGTVPLEDPRGRGIKWPDLSSTELARLLSDPRPAVRQRAVDLLGKHGLAALRAIESVLDATPSTETRRRAVWAATRINDPAARRIARKALKDSDETVRQVAIHATSVWRDAQAVPELLALLNGPSLQNRRASAEALGRIGDKSAVPALLIALAQPVDRVLEHSLIYALIEINDPQDTAAGLASKQVRVQRAALIALDQMDERTLRPETIAADLDSKEPAIKEIAAWIAGHHPEWGSALAGLLRRRLGDDSLSASDRVELEQQLARFSNAEEIRELLADRLKNRSAPRAQRITALHAMAQANLKEPPKAWIESVAEVLTGDDPELIGPAVATARALAVPKADLKPLRTALLKVVANSQAPSGLKLDALAAVPGGLMTVDSDVFKFLLDQLQPDRSVSTRSAAANVIARSKLSSEQLIALTDTIARSSPLEIDRLLTPYDAWREEEVGLKLVAALKNAPALSSLRAEDLQRHLKMFGPTVQKEAEPLYATIELNTAQQRSRLEELVAGLSNGDIRRGQAVFNSQKVACASCHKIGYIGGQVGPDLTRIGQLRTERDLLESIAFPSASFVRSYEPVAIATKDGRVFSGILRKDAPDEVVLTTSATEEARIPRDEIEELRPGTVSVMPSGLDQQLTKQELADLVAFLKACK